MPFTATLAMVASASMAGVPLLNGFLSKEMFFAETVFINSTAWVEAALPVIATLAGTFSVAYRCALPSMCSSARPPPTCPTPRTSRRAGCARRSSCWCSPAWWWASSRPSGRPAAGRCRPAGGGRHLPEYSLAIWHGWNAPMIMSLIAMSGGIVLYLLLRKQLKRGRFLPAADRRFNGKRLFEHGLVHLMLLARRIERLISTRRLQTQLFLLVLAACSPACPMLHSGLSWGDRPKIPVPSCSSPCG
jgi:multicomponent K+:H+ antiporter subunit A